MVYMNDTVFYMYQLNFFCRFIYRNTLAKMVTVLDAATMI
jgi:hypothetical protein